jgi:hypothetical protein
MPGRPYRGLGVVIGTLRGVASFCDSFWGTENVRTQCVVVLLLAAPSSCLGAQRRPNRGPSSTQEASRVCDATGGVFSGVSWVPAIFKSDVHERV